MEEQSQELVEISPPPVSKLMDGTIQPEGIELAPTYSDPSETFWRQLKFQEFEISEMSR